MSRDITHCSLIQSIQSRSAEHSLRMLRVWHLRLSLRIRQSMFCILTQWLQVLQVCPCDPSNRTCPICDNDLSKTIAEGNNEQSLHTCPSNPSRWSRFKEKNPACSHRGSHMTGYNALGVRSRVRYIPLYKHGYYLAY